MTAKQPKGRRNNSAVSTPNSADPANSSVERAVTVDDHFSYFRHLLDRANEYYLVNKAVSTYEATKHSIPFLERTLNQVESHAKEALSYGAPLYESLLFPTTNRIFNAYSKGLETSKTAVDRTKDVAILSGTLGLGLILVATQLGLAAGSTATSFLLAGFSATRNASENALERVFDLEKYVHDRIRNAIDATFELLKTSEVQNPVEKLSEHANSFLNIANNVFEHLLGLPEEKENPESSLTERIAFLAQRVLRGVSTSTSAQVLEPFQKQISTVLDQLRNSVGLVDYLKETQKWTFQQVDNLSSSVREFRDKIEDEAKLAVVEPEKALIRSIHTTSKLLDESLTKLRDGGAEVLNESMNKRLVSAIEYVKELDSEFAQAGNIYQVKDSVLEEAKQKLQEISQIFQIKLNN